jgi:hypothetical protein
MNKLVACALLGFGLTQVLVACSDDDDAPPDATSGSSTGGSKAGTSNGGSSSAGKTNGGSSSGGGKAGSANGGSGGTATGGSATAGSGGNATAGTTTDVGGEGGVSGGAGEAGMGGVAGEGGMTGDGGMAGAGGAPPVEPQAPTQIWLSHYCEAKSVEVLMCENSPEFATCYSEYRPFLSTVQEGICPGEEGENDPLVKTLALYDAIDALAAACPDPDVDQWQCTFAGAAQAKDQACRDADQAARVAYSNCNP